MEVAIETLSVMAGKFPPRALGLVTEWAVQHREELLVDWELARKRSELNKISPLE